MTDVNYTNSSLNSQCMDFCQALARQGLEFKFSVTIGSAFTFSLDARAKEGRDAPPVTTVKKKKRPFYTEEKCEAQGGISQEEISIQSCQSRFSKKQQEAAG